ncbi:MAG: hypothetical protein ACYDBO_11880, partial [Vulcanimicrobiaceae bacterium]
AGRRRRHFAPNRRLDWPSPGKAAGIIRRRLEKDGHMGNVGSSPQEWCKQAFRGRVEDQTGLRVIPLPYLVLMKYDSARVIDQADLSRMLGQLDDEKLDQIVEVVKRFSGDPGITDEIHQYAQLGRWELETRSRDVPG